MPADERIRVHLELEMTKSTRRSLVRFLRDLECDGVHLVRADDSPPSRVELCPKDPKAKPTAAPSGYA